MRTAVYPGTFDPVTKGHIHIIERSCRLFEEVIIAISTDNYKKTLFTVDERLHMMRESIKHVKNARVEGFSGLTADYAERKGAQALIRGLRAVSDFEYELQIAMMNKHLNDKLETLFLMTSGEYSFLSSSVIKQVAVLGGSVKGMVPELVEEMLKQKFPQYK